MNSESVKNSTHKKSPTLGTQVYLRISEIRENTIILKNGGLRSILKVSSINFNLKSEEEQNAIIYSYQGFLNTIDAPIQILIKSKKLEIDEYIEKLREIGKNQSNPLLQKQTYEYIDYIQKLIEYADIMEKEFYVIVPFEPYRNQKVSFVTKFFQNINGKENFNQIKQRRDEFENLKKGLTQRVNSIKVGLENCGLKVEELESSEIIELFYKVYNPQTSRTQKYKSPEKTNIINDDKLEIEDRGI